MAKLKLTIEIEQELLLPGTTHKEIEFTFLDALYEFVSHRGPTAEAYVERRYPIDVANPVYIGSEREKKIAQVNRRIAIAGVMHSAGITNVEEVVKR